MVNDRIIGVVLAGGRSSRMGRDKAFLSYTGKSLLDHMITILEQAGINNIYVSGDFEGYRCIPDEECEKGPAYAMAHILTKLKNDAGVMFIPIDMPFLTPEMLEYLMKKDCGGYFEGSYLPAFIKNNNYDEAVNSVKELLAVTQTPVVHISENWENNMLNANTPEEWEKVLKV